MKKSKRSKWKGKRINVRNVDARTILEELSIEYSEAGNNVATGWLGVMCPFCDDTSNHLGIHIQSKVATCWKCGPRGDILNYLSEHLNSFDKALKTLENYIPRELLGYETLEGPRATKVEMPKEAERGLSRSQEIYLENRGYNPEELTYLYNLHHCPPYGKWANRIIVPVVHQYTLVTFTSIDIADETEIRYRHLADELSIRSVKECLYGAELTDRRSIILVEGLFDSWRFMGGAVPVFGAMLTSVQKKLLSTYNLIKVVGDGDEAGWRFNEYVAREMSPFCKVKIFDLPSGVDPDKLNKDEIEYIKRSR